MGSLMLPPCALFFGQRSLSQFAGAEPFQVEEGSQAQLHPAFHLLELANLIVMEAQLGLELLEKELDVPAIIPSKSAVGWPGSP
jgi:hypothetical protein